MGGWYTIGLCLGLGLGLGVILSGLLGGGAVGTGVASLLGAGAGVILGIALGDAAQVVAGGVGGLLGGVSAAAVVHGAMRRGATRLGVVAYLGLGGLLVCLVSLIPLVGYLEALAVPLLAIRMRGRQAARFAGLRTLAK